MLLGACAHLSPATSTSLEAERQARETAAAVQRSERALVAAIPARDSAAIDALLAQDVVVVLPAGDTIRSSPAVAARLRSLLPADVYSLARARERGDACAHGKYEVGTLTAMRRAEGSSVTVPATLPYAVEWKVDGTGTARIVRLSFAAGHPRDREPGVRCEVLRSTVTQLGRRYAVAVVASHDVAFESAFEEGMAVDGWQSDDGSPSWRWRDRPGRAGTRVQTPAVSLRARWPLLSVEGVLPLMPTRAGGFAYNPEFDSGVTQTVSAYEAYGLVSLHRGIFRVGAGPTVLRATWETANERMGRLPQATWPTNVFAYRGEGSTTTSVGITALGGVAMPLGTRFFSELTVRYRAMPEASDVATEFYPGNRTSFSGVVASLALGRAF